MYNKSIKRHEYVFLVLSESGECVLERSFEVSKDLLATCLTCFLNAFRSDMPPISPSETFSCSTLGFTTLCQSPAPVVYVWHLFDAENTAGVTRLSTGGSLKK